MISKMPVRLTVAEMQLFAVRKSAKRSSSEATFNYKSDIFFLEIGFGFIAREGIIMMM